MDFQSALQESIDTIVRQSPFFVSKLVTIKHNVDNNQPTAYTDGESISYNEEFFLSLSFDQRITLICHELAHIIFCHHLRMRGRNVELWNVACDHAINLLLTSFRFSPLNDWLCDTQFKEWSAENIYSSLNKLSDKKKESLKKQSNNSGGSFKEPTSPNNSQLTPEELSKELEKGAKDAERARNTLDRYVKGIKRSESLKKSTKDDMLQRIGDGFLEIQNNIDDIRKSQIDWITVMKNFLFSMGQSDFNYSYPDTSLMQSSEFFFPDVITEEFGDIALCLDVSGSLHKLATQIASEAFHALNEVNKHELELFHISTKIHSHKIITSINDIQKIEGGGTNFNCFFNQYLTDNHIDFKGIIFVTDGHVNFSQWVEPDIPVLWILTKPNRYFENNVPFGDCIIMN